MIKRYNRRESNRQETGNYLGGTASPHLIRRGSNRSSNVDNRLVVLLFFTAGFILTFPYRVLFHFDGKLREIFVFDLLRAINSEGLFTTSNYCELIIVHRLELLSYFSNKDSSRKLIGFRGIVIEDWFL